MNDLEVRVKAALRHTSDVDEKRMFRGTAFMVNGKMCICTNSTGLMCRIDPAIQQELEQMEGVSPMLMKGKPCKGYVEVALRVVQSDEELDFWVKRSLDFNDRARASKKRKK